MGALILQFGLRVAIWLINSFQRVLNSKRNFLTFEGFGRFRYRPFLLGSFSATFDLNSK